MKALISVLLGLGTVGWIAALIFMVTVDVHVMIIGVVGIVGYALLDALWKWNDDPATEESRRIRQERRW